LAETFGRIRRIRRNRRWEDGKNLNSAFKLQSDFGGGGGDPS
jgi:hypothetical protein